MGWFAKGKKPDIPSNDVFPAIDVDRIGNDLDLDSAGARNGRNDMPETNRSTFDATETGIRDKVEKYRREGLSRCGEHMRVYRDRIGQLEGIGSNIRAAANKAETDFQAEVSERRKVLDQMRKEFGEVRDELNRFQADNRLGRTPHPDNGGIRWWAIAIVILTIESALNGVFFAEAHVKGIVGGVVIALVISVLNIGAATIAGHLFRNANHIRIWRKTIGVLALIVGVFIALVGNFCVGHFRDAAIEAPLEQTPGLVFERLAAGRYLMDSLDAWLLAALGLLIAAIAGWKAYTMTDPYPGYGRVGRKYTGKQKELNDLHDESLDALRDTRDEATDKLNQERDEAESKIDSALSAFRELSALQERRDTFLHDCNTAANRLLTIYRDANRKTRETPAPVYFSESHEFPREPALKPPSRPDEESMQRYRRTVDDSIERIHEECKNAISSFERVVKTADRAA